MRNAAGYSLPGLISNHFKTNVYWFLILSISLLDKIRKNPTRGLALDRDNINFSESTSHLSP